MNQYTTMSKQTAIPESTFKFLRDLSKNNQRDWFQKHKGRYTSAHENFKEFSSTLFNEMSKIDNVEEAQVVPHLQGCPFFQK